MVTVATTNSFNLINGDGSNVTFPYTFELPDSSDGSDIYLYVIDDEGTITQITSNYTWNEADATFTYPNTAGISPLEAGITALPTGWQLCIMRVEPLTQAVNLTTLGPFPASSLMAQVDFLTMLVQQQQEQINRCVKFPIGQVPTTTDVNDFIDAVNAIIATPPISGTLAYLKSISALAPTTTRFGIATDLGAGNALMWYGGDILLGDGGWFGPLAQG